MFTALRYLGAVLMITASLAVLAASGGKGTFKTKPLPDGGSQECRDKADGGWAADCAPRNDAGYRTDCAAHSMACSVYDDDLPDGGAEYSEQVFTVNFCSGGPDDDDELPPGIARKVQAYNKGQCIDLGPATSMAPGKVKRTASCVCRKPGAAPCRIDGKDIPTGAVYGPAPSVGAGCVPTVCVELAGISSFPAACR